jgi:hypothetical protein
MRMEELLPYETSINFYQSTGTHIPEDSSLDLILASTKCSVLECEHDEKMLSTPKTFKIRYLCL